MLVAHGRQAIASIGPRILFIAHPYVRRFHQADDRCQHFLARHTRLREVLFHTRPNRRQRRRKVRHPLILVFVARLSPLRVISALLASACIPARCLQMPVRERRNPHACPRRGNHKRLDPPQRLLVANDSAIGSLVTEATTRLQPPDPRPVIGHIPQTRFPSGLCRIGYCDYLSLRLLCFTTSGPWA